MTTTAETSRTTATSATQAEKKSITLLLVDVQKDFHPGGSLAIPTANDDAERIAQLIASHSSKITRIIATMDTHYKLHIAHPCFWVNGNEETKKHPTPFTIISHEDILQGKWKPRSDLSLSNQALTKVSMFDVPNRTTDTTTTTTTTMDLLEYVKEYTKRLEENGRFQLCIWPEHCLVGSDGHAIVDCVQNAMNEWSNVTGKTVEYIQKGQHLLTEMYSVLQAEVPVSQETSFNHALMESLLSEHQQPQHGHDDENTDLSTASSVLWVAGQAMSHCVNYTLRDIVDHWPLERRQDIVLLTDGASCVPGFEVAGDTFQKDMIQAGIQLAKISNIMPME